MTEYHPKKLTDPTAITEFMLAGNATITLVSKASQARFTFKVTKPKPAEDGNEGPVGWFVSLLTGADNETSFAYLGHIYRKNHDYTLGKKSKISVDAPGAKAFNWFYQHVIKGNKTPDSVQLEVWHEGKCGRCGRKLTVPESISRGIGPECAGMVDQFALALSA